MTTRREIVKAGAGLAAIIAAGKAPAALVRSLVAARNTMMGGRRKKSPLPPGARFVEYLESTGTQFIDTGMRATAGTGVSVDFEITGYNPSLDPESLTNNSVVGAQNDGWAGNAFALSAYEDAGLHVWGMIGDGSESYFDVGVQTNRRYTASMNFRSSSVMDFGGSIAANVSDAEKALCNTLTSNIYLFAASSNNGKSKTTCSICKIYGAAVSLGANVVRDFRPIAIGSTGYMLDLVSGEYLPYGNAGTDAFRYGNDI